MLDRLDLQILSVEGTNDFQCVVAHNFSSCEALGFKGCEVSIMNLSAVAFGDQTLSSCSLRVQEDFISRSKQTTENTDMPFQK